MIIDYSTKLDFNDVLIRPKRSTLESRKDVNLVRKFVPKYGKPFEGVPIIAANMATGTFGMLRSLAKAQMFTAIAKHHNTEWPKMKSEEDINQLESILDYGFYTIGMSQEELQQLIIFSGSLYGGNENLKICIDIANGYTQKFASFVSQVRKYFPYNVIVAGNVATPEMVQELVIAGADYIKIGIGPSLSCDTRMKTGVGYPQLSAIIEGADASHGLGAGIVADGGCKVPGDISKALCAGSDFVMLGNMLAGTDEQDGEIITRYYETNEIIYKENGWHRIQEEKRFKIFYGMSSEYAQQKHGVGLKGYRASEGNVRELPYVGSVSNIVQDIEGSLRSTGAYIGAKIIKDFPKCATFSIVNRQK